MNKPVISIVVAMNPDGIIGVDNQLPWHIPEDLQHFKQCTMGKPIIMGRKTFESIGRILPHRKNIIISSCLKLEDILGELKQVNMDVSGVISINNKATMINDMIAVYSSLEGAIADNTNCKELCIIGGGEIFKLAMPLVSKIYLTIIDVDISTLKSLKQYSITNYVPYIVRFPLLNMEQWKIIHETSIIATSGVKCTFQDLLLNKT